MRRSFSHDAVVLRVRPSFDANREAFFLTPDAGLIAATVFGGHKSKLASHVSQFHSGRLYVYSVPSKEQNKVTDFDVTAWRPGMRELLERAAAAGAIAQTVLAGFGGGGDSQEEAFALTEKALDALEAADKAYCGRIFLHFLWNWAGILGVRFDVNACAVCGRNTAVEPVAGEAVAGGACFYSGAESGLLCPDCARRTATSTLWLPLNADACAWLKAACERPVTAAVLPLSGASFRQIRAVCTEMVAGSLGYRPDSWDLV
jgi:DNA repair protein RecO (recombination protein O)